MTRPSRLVALVSRASSSRLVALAALLLLVGCGASSPGVAATTNTAPDQARDPRTQDPTAVQAAPPASAGTSVPLGKGPRADAPGASGAGGDAAPGSRASAADDAAPKKISARHVLVQWMGTDRAGKSVLRTREQAMVLIQEVQRRAKAGDDLGRLAVEYSDEPNAGARGGSLGRFGKGQMVAAFEGVAFKLKVGEISDIVETPFGFHIIQRTE